MKTTTLKIAILSLLFCTMGAGCEKEEEQILEISPTSRATFIQKEVNGIQFKFCLLNEQGEPATVFNENENFSFSFSINNGLEDTLTITTEFISSEFFRVYNFQDNIDMGKPWTGLWCEYSLAEQKIILQPFQTTQIKCPWLLTENSPLIYPLCMSESKEPLAKGNYYSKLNLDFHYSKNEKNELIDNLTFRINFNIQ